jgi:regulatory protein YycH of two-component signal transduction system YycFG
MNQKERINSFRSTEILITIDRISRKNPFFTQNFSMSDVDSLPDMYETMIDRPAFIYDSLSDLTYSFTKNIPTISLFFVNELNYTYEQCEEIFNHTIINTIQVRMKENKDHLYAYIFSKEKTEISK